MIVVGYYTNEKYRQQAQAMKASAEAVGLRCEISEKPDLGTWWQNCNHKSAFLVECLNRYGEEPVLYQDADTRFLRYPKLLDTIEGDMAAFFFSPTVPVGGCLWFNGKRRSLRYAEAWAKMVSDNPTREDDSMNFRDALKSIKCSNIRHLPPSYGWNEDMRGIFPGVTEPVVVHSFIGMHNYPII